MSGIQQGVMIAQNISTAVTYATWNPADKGTNITLSGGDLTATGVTTAWSSVRSTIGVSTGKHYWEENIITDDTIGAIHIVGIMNSSANINNYIGVDINGWGYQGNNGGLLHNGSYSGTVATYAAGDIIGVALDMDTGTIEFFKNNVSQGVAYTGLTGTLYAATSQYNLSATTTNFGATTMTYTAPTGFNQGLYN